MTQVTGVVEHGAIKVDQPVPLPDGTRVRLTVEKLEGSGPLEREALSREDVETDVRWATGKQFGS